MSIDFSKFKAAMFDYDGTLTEKGIWEIDQALAERMGELLVAGFPLAICTGRQLDSFEKRFGPTFRMIREKFGDEAAGRLYFLAENGAVGYEYDFSDTAGSGSDSDSDGSWRIFYQAEWPSAVPKKEFESGLEEILRGKVEFLTHLVPIVIAPLGRYDMDISVLNKASSEVFKIAHEYASKFEALGGGNALDHLHIGDSGLGVLICPADGDKDSAVRVFWELLSARGVKFLEKSPLDGGSCREIMVVGDSPQKRGNDYYFLNGRYGTAFSVGVEPEAGSEWPIVVRDESGEPIMNSRGTLALLNKLPNLET